MDLPVVFISDAHLGVNTPFCVANREEKLVQFLNQLRGKISHLVIAGDLFEFWFEYRDYVCRNHFELYFSLRELVKSGVEVHLLQGNHDFAYEDFFPKTLGVQVHKQVILEVQGKRVLCCHGDGVAKSDKGYRVMRKILDFPLNRKLFKLIHPDWGMSLARFVGSSSRKAGETRVINMDEYLEWAGGAMKKNCCEYCVLGHHHIAGVWPVKNGVVASAGDWMKKLTYVQMEAGELVLKDFL